MRLSAGSSKLWKPFSANLTVSISNGFLFGSSQHTIQLNSVSLRPRSLYYFEPAISDFPLDQITRLTLKFEPVDESAVETVDISEIQVTEFVVSSWTFSTKIFCLEEKEPLVAGKFYKASTKPGLRRCN